MTKNEEIIAMLETIKEQAQSFYTLKISKKRHTIIKDVSKDSFIFVIDKAIEGLNDREVNNGKIK